MTILRARGAVAFSAVTLLIWILSLFDIASGLLQSPCSAFGFRGPILPRYQTRSILLASTVSTADETSDLREDDTQPIAYDWDEQFDDLQKFKSEYGHCNFPQNPSKDLKQEYPLLERFCQDQRGEYKLLPKTQGQNTRMAMAVSDRENRYRQLTQLGFAFKPIEARWYDFYHELLEHSRENGHTRVDRSKNEPLANWIYKQRTRRNATKGYSTLSDLEIKLLDDIGFEWESELYDAMWNEKYEELVAFRNKQGNFIMESGNLLYKWMTRQRQRRAGKKGYKALTGSQIHLLDEIEFPWKADRQNSKWFAMYDELKRFQKEYGHIQPDRSTHRRLYSWTQHQILKHQKGHLSTEKINLLNEIHFPWERNRRQWMKMLTELIEYCRTHGHLQVSQEDEPELYEWMELQRKLYHGSRKTERLSDKQIEKLEDLHFCWSLQWRGRTWHEKYTEAVEYFKEKGHLKVNKKENPSLYNWIQSQGKRYKLTEGQKPLSEEELEMLEQIDFPFLEGQPRISWNAVYAKVTNYREENDGRLPTSHNDDPDLSRWLRHQRYRYRSSFGYAPLSDEQKEMLQSIDLSMYPKSKRKRKWYEMYDELVDFKKDHGHFLVDRFENPTLYAWMAQQRLIYHGTATSITQYIPLSKLQLYLMDRIDFSWTSERVDVEWKEMYDELVKFQKEHGHLRLKTKSRLHEWAKEQRKRYNGTGGTARELSEYEIMQLKKIGFEWSLRRKS